jgi:hypothetical protein
MSQIVNGFAALGGQRRSPKLLVRPRSRLEKRPVRPLPRPDKQGWFEVIAGKSVVAFRREEEAEAPPAKGFGFVQTYDREPRGRLWESMKSRGMQENQ